MTLVEHTSCPASASRGIQVSVGEHNILAPRLWEPVGANKGGALRPGSRGHPSIWRVRNRGQSLGSPAPDRALCTESLWLRVVRSKVMWRRHEHGD